MSLLHCSLSAVPFMLVLGMMSFHFGCDEPSRLGGTDLAVRLLDQTEELRPITKTAYL